MRRQTWNGVIRIPKLRKSSQSLPLLNPYLSPLSFLFLVCSLCFFRARRLTSIRSLPSHAGRSTLISHREFLPSHPAASLEPFPPFYIRVIPESPRGDSRREDVHLSLMEGSHTKSVRQTSDPSTMALIQAPGAASHAPQDPLKASESLIANFVHLDIADLIFAVRYSAITSVPPMDGV